MTAPADLIILCAGGHARVVIDILRRGGRAVAALTDANKALHGTQLDGVNIIGGEETVLARDPREVILVNALGNGAAHVGDSGLAPRQGIDQRTFAGIGRTDNGQAQTLPQHFAPARIIYMLLYLLSYFRHHEIGRAHV